MSDDPPHSPGLRAKPLVPFVYVLPQLVEQEALRWRVVSANPSLAASSGTGSQPASDDTGGEESDSFIIKHSQLVGSIHDYFCQLEKNHACIHLAGRKITDDEFKAINVKHMSPEPMANTDTPATSRKLVILKDEDQLMYRCSLMCAQFAVLSAPSPPEGDSPTPSVPVKLFSDTAMTTGPLSPSSLARSVPTNLTNQLPMLSNHRNEEPVATPSEFVSSSDTFYSVEPELVTISNSDYDSFSMVTREMLCDLVKQSFSQTEEQQLQHEHIIRVDNNRRSKGEVLAKELVTQLLVLENNSHGFYQPMAFYSRNCYDQWLQSEKKRIRAMLDKFWHYSLPRPSSSRQCHPIDYHRIYLLLLQRLVKYELSIGVPATKDQNGVLVSTLSHTSRRLLKEFSLRYGVGDLYCQISYLELISKNFSPELSYIVHCTQQLVTIRESLPKSRSRLTATRKEMEMLRGAVLMLHAQCDQCLTKVERIFPANFSHEGSKEGIASLITLLAEVLCTQQVLFSKKLKPLRDWLKKYLKVGMAYRYERKKNIAENEVVENLRVPYRLSPVLLNVMIAAVKGEVKDYRENFQEAFEKYLDVVALAKEEFYNLLCADVTKLCTRITAKPETKKEPSHQMLGLMYRMNELDCNWNSVVTAEMQTWRNPFTDLATIVMDVLNKQLLLWILVTIEVDQWDLLPIRSDLLQQENDKTKQSPSSTGPRSEASSVLLPTFTSLAASETSAFTGVIPTPLHAADDVVTTPTSSPSTYYSEDDWTDSPRQGNNHLQSSGYPRTTNETVSFARGHLRPKPPALTTVEIHNEMDNGEYSSSIMTPVKDGELPTRTVDPYEEEDTTMVDSWNEAELIVPGSPAVHLLSMESDPTVSLLTTTVGPTTSSSYKETIPSMTPPNVVRPVAVKPPKGKIGSGRKKRRSQQSQVDFSDSSASDVIPPASVATAPALKPWNNMRKGQKVSNHLTTMPTILHSNDNLVSMTTSIHSENLLSHYEGPDSAMAATSETSVLCAEQQRLLPVSSSPVDIVVMLSRMASFCASLTLVLAPKLPVNTGISADRGKMGHELSSEVTLSRHLSSQLRKRATTVMKMFQHKLHRCMVQTIRLYADNLVSMDVCGWSVTGAKRILGEMTFANLRLRSEGGEIWGCRHEIEKRAGLHSNGLPCNRTLPFNHYEPITKSMCTRINNMEALIRVLPKLEASLEKASRVAQTDQHITAHGYVSSEPNDVTDKSQKGAVADGNMAGSSTEWTSGSSIIHHLVDKEQPEEGFYSESSRQLLKYLKQLRHAQIQLVCYRMNRLIEPGLSLLLELQLPSYTLEKRMAPLSVWLIRHRDAFYSHLYPECFQELMHSLWELILQDLEHVALDLRKEKKHPTNKAMLILRVLSHFITIMHWNGKGLPLEHLVSADDFLVTILSYYTRPTDKLLQDFDKLNGQLQSLQVDFSHAPIAIDIELVRDLRCKLHCVKKCFTGKQFVDSLLAMSSTAVEDSTVSSPSGGVLQGHRLDYGGEYATELGQYLLDCGLLTVAGTASHNLMHATPNPSEIDSSIERHSQPMRRVFELPSLYKFSEAEDTDFNLRKHQVFLSVTEKMNKKLKRSQHHQQMPVEERARLGTLLLVSDILLQRSRHERRLKDFVKSNRFMDVSRELARNEINCLYIVHL